MGLFGKLFKGPEIDQAKSQANKEKMRALFNQVVEHGDQYRLLACYTEDVRRFNYGLVHGSKSTIASLIVGWREDDPTVVLVPTVPDLSGCGDPEVLRKADILKAYHEKMMDSLVIYPDQKSYTALKTFSWLEDEKLYIYVDQEQEEKDFRDFFLHTYATK